MGMTVNISYGLGWNTDTFSSRFPMFSSCHLLFPPPQFCFTGLKSELLCCTPEKKKCRIEASAQYPEVKFQSCQRHLRLRAVKVAARKSFQSRSREVCLRRSGVQGGGEMDEAGVGVQEPQSKVQKLNGVEEKTAHNGVHADKVVINAQALRVKKLSPHAILPVRGSALAAGYDLSSAYDSVVPARGKALVKTDLSIAIPKGTYARVAPRSGLAWKHSIDVGAGVIDADYRGPVGVILFNHSETDFTIKAGDRIAQLILELIVTPDVAEVDDLDVTARGEGGFGSTGVSLTVET